MKEKIIIISVIALFSFISCGDSTRDREYYGDLSQTPGGIVINDEGEHEGGYGRSECLLCHNAYLNIHRGPDSGIDLDAFVEEVQRQGSVYCRICHGQNGIE